MKFRGTLLIIVTLCLAGCKKEKIIETKIVPAPGKGVSIKVDQVINDSTVVVKWTKYAGKGFKKYVLTRAAKVIVNGKLEMVNFPGKEYTNADELTYEDRDMPYARQIIYNLMLITDHINTSAFATTIHIRTTAYAEVKFNDVQINRTAKRFYLSHSGSGSITAYDYAAGKVLKSVEVDRAIGYIATAAFEGKPEVYVPTNDGWLLILDGETLEQKDRIYVGGYNVSSVLAVDGKLIVSSSDRTYSSTGEQGIKIYNRAGKVLLGVTGYYHNTRLLYLEGSNYDLIDMTTNMIPVRLSAYWISADGVPQQKFHGYSAEVDPAILKSFPGGGRFITSSAGTVFNRQLDYIKSITEPNSLRYSDFEFNESGSLIYGAVQNQPKVSELSYADNSVLRTFTTKLIPYRIFRDGSQLLVINREESDYNAPSALFVEKIKL